MSFIFIISIIFLGRVNSSLLGYEFLNTDELLIGSKALRLIKNNFNLYEFDGDTSGILNGIFLTWPSILDLDITYLSIRLSAVLVVSITLYFTYKLLCLNIKKIFSIFLLLPLILFYSLTKDPDFLHYANELITTLLIIASLYILFLKKKDNYIKYYFTFSFLMGSILFAKMQFFPLASFLVFLLFVNQAIKYKNFKSCLFICLGFMLPTFLVSIYYYLNSELIDLFYNVIHYPLSDLFARNLQSEQIIADNNSLLKISNINKTQVLLDHLLYNSVFHLFYLYLIYLLLIIYYSKFTNLFKNISFELILISLGIILTLIISVGTGSVHRHYLIVVLPLLPIFLSILIRDTKINLMKNRNFLVSMTIFLCLFLVSLFSENFKFYSKKFVHSKFSENNFNFYNPGILDFFGLNKKDQIIAWGWNPEIYILSNLSPASRDTINQKQIDFKSNRKYFRERFVKDFKKNKPALIIDYVKPGGYMFTDEKFNVNNIKEIEKLLISKYIKLENLNRSCEDIYLNKDNYKKFKSNLINFEFKEKNLNLNKLNDLRINEKFCDTAVIFKKDYPKTINLLIKEKNNIKEIILLASKKNTRDVEIELVFYSKNGNIKKIKKNLKKFPFWTIFNLKDLQGVEYIELDTKNLIEKNFGLNEIKIYQ